MAVFVLDKRKNPLMPASEKRARLLLQRGRAVVIKMYPFTNRLKDRVGGEVQPIRLKIDPGSLSTGIAVVKKIETGDTTTCQVTNLFQINHRGQSISSALTSRRAMRRRRRNKLRYREARFDNRTRPKGWLAPSLQHRVDTVTSLITKLQKLLPVTDFSMELVRFDMQKMENPEISNIEYQQGELQGYEIREYLLEKWDRTCAYCKAEGIPLEVEHIVPKSKGGSNRISNLTLACHQCNCKKGNQSIEVFLEKRPDLLQKLLRRAKQPLKDAAAVNSTRFALANRLKTSNLPLELSSGGRTKFNRIRLSIPKTHALDAACVGEVNILKNWDVPTIEITCTGRGSYQRTRLDKYGFPRSYLTRLKSIKGFQTGDQVKAIVTKGKKVGEYRGRVAVRATGSFNITTAAGTIQGISFKDCTLIARNDGYGYTMRAKTKELFNTCKRKKCYANTY
ncbi:MAG: RNA-guided endonuclease IscB [Chlamydiae bacterium]|nr:RNA-guided endonuclease IscB [Chlamydiota bacterium]